MAKLSNYSLLKENKDSYHIQHTDGNSFKVAKNLLTPDLHQKMAKLPKVLHATDGGGVPKSDPNLPNDFDRTISDITEPSAETQQKLAEQQASLPTTNPDQGLGGDIPAIDPTAAVSPAQEPTQEPTQATAADAAQQPQSASPAAPAPQTPAQVPGTDDTSTIPFTSSKSAPKDSILKSPMDEYNAGVKEEQAGIEAKASAEGAVGAQQAKIQEKLQASLNAAKVNFDARKKALDDQSAKLFDDIQTSKVDPGRFYNSLSTGSQIAAAVSIALGGLGGGVSGHGGNIALDTINKAIDRDIDAQKTDLNNKNTLLARNLEQTHNLNEAEQITRSQLLTVANAQIAKTTAQNMGQQAQAQKLQLMGSLNQKIAQQHLSMASTGMVMDLVDSRGTGQPPDQTKTAEVIKRMMVLDPEKGKNLASIFLPGAPGDGLASGPIPPAVKQKLIDQKTALDSATKLREFAQKNAGSLNPATIQEGKALAFLTLNQYRTGTGQGVYKESQAEADKKLVAEDPTAFFNKFRTDPKYKVLQQSLIHEYNNNLKGAGFSTMYEDKPLNTPAIKGQ